MPGLDPSRRPLARGRAHHGGHQHLDPSDENRKLNRKIVDHAIALTEILRGRLHVVTCWFGYMESVLTSPRFNEEEKVKYLEFEQRQTEKAFQSLLADSGLGNSVRGKVLHGNPAKIIPQYAAEQNMDIVVMGSVARTGVPGLIVGNTAEKIVSDLKNSILAVKPDGFRLPGQVGSAGGCSDSRPMFRFSRRAWKTLYSKGNRLDAFIFRSEMLERMFTTPGIFRSTPSIKSL